MTLTPKPFIAFYDSIGFAPTRQKSKDATLHEARRRYLYRCLGVAPIAVRGSDILEFGPGSGENSSVLLAMGPNSYTFVDGSKAVLANLRSAFEAQSDGDLALTASTGIHLVLSEISAYRSKALYDLVVCEGVLPLQMRPQDMASHVLSFVRPGGVGIVTCLDSVSGFSEIVRRYLASEVFGVRYCAPEFVDELVDFFAPDFDLLPGMSRSAEDWVLDSIVNPWVGDFFSVEDALKVADGDGALLGSSPDVFCDWRWYKDPTTVNEKTAMRMVVSTYRANLHNFIDTRVLNSAPLDESESSKLIEVTLRIASRVRRHMHEAEPYHIFEFQCDLSELLIASPSLSEITKQSVQALINWCASGSISDLCSFRGMWGRGQQYLSFVRIGVDSLP